MIDDLEASLRAIELRSLWGAGYRLVELAFLIVIVVKVW